MVVGQVCDVDQQANQWEGNRLGPLSTQYANANMLLCCFYINIWGLHISLPTYRCCYVIDSFWASEDFTDIRCISRSIHVEAMGNTLTTAEVDALCSCRTGKLSFASLTFRQVVDLFLHIPSTAKELKLVLGKSVVEIFTQELRCE